MNQESLKFSIGVGAALSRAWDATMRNFWPIIGFTLLYFIARMMLSAIPIAGLVGNLFEFISYAAYYSAFEAADRKGRIEFGDLFNWTPRFGRLLLAYLLLILVILLFIAPALIYVGLNLDYDFSYDPALMFRMLPSATLPLFGLYVLVVGIVLLISSFAFLFLAWNCDIPLGETLRLSISIGKNNVGAIILFMLMAFVIGLAGILALFLGFFVALPLIVGVQYYLLRSIFPLHDATQWDFMSGERAA